MIKSVNGHNISTIKRNCTKQTENYNYNTIIMREDLNVYLRSGSDQKVFPHQLTELKEKHDDGE